MNPILLEIGRFKLYSFGSFIALGAILSGLFAYMAAKSRGLQTSYIFDTFLYTLLAGLIGARIGYYFAYQHQFQSLAQIFFFWQGGLLALTGIAAGFAMYYYQVARLGDSIWKWLDIGVLAFLLAWGTGNVGCVLSGCSLGRPGTFLTINGAYPVDLFASIWAIGLYLILLASWQKKKINDGIAFFLALEGLFLGQLVLKTFKSDFGEGLSQVEAVSYLILIIGVYGLFWQTHGPKVNQKPIVGWLKTIKTKWPSSKFKRL